MGKRKEMDVNLIDDSKVYCFDKNIEKYLDGRITENTENFKRTTIEILALFVISDSDIQKNSTINLI